MTTAAPATVVLVHGAWHGPWCFNHVVDGLNARGVPTLAVDRRRPGPDGQLRAVTDSDENERIVRAALDQIDGPVVLLGHSFGGVAITTAPLGNDSVKHLVYLTAMMPDTDGAVPDNFANPELVAAIQEADDGSTMVEEGKIRQIFYHQCPDADVERAMRELTPNEAAITFDAPREAAWKTIPTTYVVCTEDQALLAPGQRQLARRANRIAEWPTDHSPFFSNPQLLINLLHTLSQEHAA